MLRSNQSKFRPTTKSALRPDRRRDAMQGNAECSSSDRSAMEAVVVEVVEARIEISGDFRPSLWIRAKANNNALYTISHHSV